MSIISEFCLLSMSVGRLQPKPDYLEVYEIFTKNTVFYAKLSYCSQISIFETLCLGRSKNLHYVWKKLHKNEKHLCLIAYIFTKISQNACLINLYILINHYARFNCKLRKVIWFYCVFLGYFHTFLMTIHVWKVVSPPNFHRLCI